MKIRLIYLREMRKVRRASPDKEGPAGGDSTISRKTRVNAKFENGRFVRRICILDSRVAPVTLLIKS